MRLSAMSEMALWFPYANRPRGKMRLFTFPYAGSGASVFHNWFLPLYDSVDLYALQLPGRESRAAEAPYRDMEEAGGAIADCLANLFDDDVPYVFFGHSMGALLAYRVACVLRARGRTEPCRLTLSRVRRGRGAGVWLPVRCGRRGSGGSSGRRRRAAGSLASGSTGRDR